MPILSKIHLYRIKETIGVFYDLGFHAWIKGMRLHYLLPIRKRFFGFSQKQKIKSLALEEAYAKDVKNFPNRLRLALEKLGAAYIKLGQMLSLRPDIVTPAIADELRKLQDRVSPFPFSEVKTAVEKEFGKPLKKLFKEFDEKPSGSASLAQVHRAVLPSGKVVAVKVLRPNIESLVMEDILLLKWISSLLEENVPATRPYHPKKLIEEFADWTLKELNLINEATNIEHFRALFADDEHISIPAVEWKYTSKRVLTTEFNHGARIDDFSAYPRLKCSRKEIAAAGTRMAFRQFFEYGFFHGDPHPGNLFINKDNTIVLYDFGIVGRISAEMRRELIGCYIDFFERDAEGAVRHLIHMATTYDKSDIDGFKRKVIEIFEKWFYAPTAGVRLSTSFYEVIVSGAAHGVLFPGSIVLLAKAIVTMESLALRLDPSFDIVENLRPYLNRLLATELKPERLLKQGREALLDSANLSEEFPEAARRLIKLLEKEEVGVKLDTREFVDIKKEIDRQSDIRILSMILVADLLATAVLLHLEGVKRIIGVPLGTFGLLVGAFLAISVLFKVRKKPTL